MELNHARNYCSIAKNNSKGAFDRKEFKIPVVVALNLLDTEYIPHFFNPIDCGLNKIFNIVFVDI